MNRRGFLRLLGLGAAGYVLDPELALWVPGQKTIFDLGGIVQPTGGNTFLTIDIITQEALRVLEQNLSFVKMVNRAYDDTFMGKTVHVVRPARYL
jgi:hypothetical protein